MSGFFDAAAKTLNSRERNTDVSAKEKKKT